jgi:hypothetical protein
MVAFQERRNGEKESLLKESGRLLGDAKYLPMPKGIWNVNQLVT